MRGAVIMALLALSAAGWLAVGLPVPPVRLGLLLLLAAIVALGLRSGRRYALLSPLFLLAVLVIIFYSLTTSVMPFLPPGLVSGWGERWAPAFLGHGAERLVLGFAALCLAAHAGISAFCPTGEIALTLPRGRPVLLRALCLGLAALEALWTWASPRYGLLSAPVASIAGMIMPFLTMTVTLLVLDAIHVPSRRRMSLLVSGLALMVMLSYGVGKEPLLLMVCLALAGLLASARIAVMLGGVAILAALLIGAMTSLPYTRGLMGPNIPVTPYQIAVAAVGKLGERQAESGYCLSRVVDRAGMDQTSDSPFYFLGSVIPRIVWPHKPSLSQGRLLLWDRYCGTPERVVAGYSGSPTLLGKPLIRAVWAGLAVATAFMLALLSAISLFGSRGSGRGYALMLAIGTLRRPGEGEAA
ncbi:hypothetical protein [Magnetospirillum sp. 15-1]|uniref:hypothetical protein n=1 Tax=Magnetospirillum sp. 15-1 TaxID=1979370 RepID=UPI000BBC1C27|nr:hypothetical protein [Magnetospirillum sp. 15-1]